MNAPAARPASDTGRLWPLLFPAAYALHIAEEVWGGEGFVAWAARHLSDGFTPERFLLINAVAWPAMLAASLAAVRSERLVWIVVALATVAGVNGTLHVGSSLLTGSYSPGAVTGLLLYLPLAASAVRRVRGRVTRRGAAAGVGLGLAAHALVFAAVLANG